MASCLINISLHVHTVDFSFSGTPYGQSPMMAPPATQPPVPAFNPVVNQPAYEAFPSPASMAAPVPAAAPPTMFNPMDAAPGVASPPNPVGVAAAPVHSNPEPAPSVLPSVPSFQASPPPNYGWNDPPSAAAANAKPNQNSNLRKLKPSKPAMAPMELPAGMLNPAAFVPPSQVPAHAPAAPQPGYTAAPMPPNAWMAPNVNPPPAAPANNVAPNLPAAPNVAPAPPPPAPVVKKSIPAEYQMLHDTFADALTRCQGATKNPVMKRKLDDVGKKLEILADKLRESSVSTNVLGGLQQMASAVGAKDYQTGLKVYALIVRGGNFAEISSFMPGLKTLMQSATQLRV